MTQEEIIEKVVTYLDQHLSSLRGYLGQEPYKRDFFALFKEAYKRGYFNTSTNPCLTGDAFRSIVVARWFTNDEKENEKRTKLMDQLFTYWDECRYAWDRYE